ncbi:MAG: glycosyltransferase family 2 protein [Planctomycetota bacterium]|nr:glycosyltransferase family 2 protein [Planctomycetota bacterium]
METAEQDRPVTFSFISPVYNEADGLEELTRRLTAVAEQLGEPYEIIFVNDGSTDESGAVLRRLADRDRRIKIVEFSRNFGHQVAVTAGYDHAAGRAVISLDADCQHPPEMIPQLIDRWREGYEVVYTVRQDTEGISAFRRGLGRLAYRLIRLCSGVELTDQADFRLLDAGAVAAVRSAREHARLVRGLVRWVGFRQVSVPYKAGQRAAGKSSYSLRQLAGMLAAGVFNYSVRPLRLAPMIGAIMLAVVAVYTVVSLLLWPFGISAGGWTHVVMMMLGLFGLQFMLIGLLGEYIGRIFEEAKARPLYVVRERIGFAKPEAGAGPSETKADRKSGRFCVYT